jgi:hypothetical protein
MKEKKVMTVADLARRLRYYDQDLEVLVQVEERRNHFLGTFLTDVKREPYVSDRYILVLK